MNYYNTNEWDPLRSMYGPGIESRPLYQNFNTKPTAASQPLIDRSAPPAGFQGVGGAAPTAPTYNSNTTPQTVNPQLVMDAYQQITGRKPTQDQLSALLQEFGRGLTVAGAVQSGVTSPEVKARQDYERAYTTAYRPGYREFSQTGQYFQPIYTPSYGGYPAPAAPYRPTQNYGFDPRNAPGALSQIPQFSGFGFRPQMPIARGHQAVSYGRSTSAKT